MTGPGIYSYSTTAASNVLANTGINWDEGMAPAAVNNSARQNMTDLRNAFNDLIWFRYGKGDLDYSPVYVSGTSYKIAGADVSSIYQIGRRTKAVGSGTGTIYGTISNVAFSTDTTVTVIWDSGSLSNETLTVYLSQVPVTGAPVSSHAIDGTNTNDDAAAGRLGEYLSAFATSSVAVTNNTAANITSKSLTAGDWLVYVTLTAVGQAATVLTDLVAGISATSATLPSGASNRINTDRTDSMVPGRTMSGSFASVTVGPHRVSVASTTTYYAVVNALFSAGTLEVYGTIAARRIR